MTAIAVGYLAIGAALAWATLWGLDNLKETDLSRDERREFELYLSAFNSARARNAGVVLLVMALAWPVVIFGRPGRQP